MSRVASFLDCKILTITKLRAVANIYYKWKVSFNDPLNTLSVQYYRQKNRIRHKKYNHLT